MEVNDILNSLNSYDCNEKASPIQNCNHGCGFNSWIWILLILFYSGRRRNDCCCPKRRRSDVRGIGSESGCGFLFLLVILFICNRCNSDRDNNNNFFNGTIF